ncbi:MAG: histidine phosphatase family protein [Oscillospiraceae bacterium]|nr:histidine phosphatase family protein [Oscillospiraceae bacterium]
MKICLIRHGETDWNVARKLQGREDILLNKNGILQAKQCGLALSDTLWRAIITSPLLRAKQTADIMADVLEIQDVFSDDGFIERDYGKASGLSEIERKTLFPDGKYEGMEEWETLRDRVCSSVVKYAAEFYPHNIIIISHGGAINSVLAQLSNHEIGSGKTRLKNACINMLSYDGKVIEIVFYNKSCDEVLGIS